ncbi:MAG: ferritin family protein [Candidatus Binatia bacterium]|nr:ferritin family protein [Candidatus Binatia bacterium]
MSKTLREILIESLKGELQAADFYTAVADNAASEEVKHYARQFAAEEEKHFHSLVDWVEQDGNPALRAVLQEVRLLLTEPSREPALLKAWQERYSHTRLSSPLRALLEMAIAKESESIRYFRALEEQVADPLSRRLLGKIRQDEERHKRFLEEQYGQLFGDPYLPAS